MTSEASFYLARRLAAAFYVYVAYGGAIPKLGRLEEPPTEIHDEAAPRVREQVARWLNELLRANKASAFTEISDGINGVRAELSPAAPSADVLRAAFEWSREHLDPNAEWRNPFDLRRLTPLFDDRLGAGEQFLVIPLAERVGVRTSTNRFVVAESLVADIDAWRRWVTGRRQLPIVDITEES